MAEQSLRSLRIQNCRATARSEKTRQNYLDAAPRDVFHFRPNQRSLYTPSWLNYNRPLSSAPQGAIAQSL